MKQLISSRSQLLKIKVIPCQINIFCHQLTKNMTADSVKFTKIYTNCSEIQNLQNLCFEFSVRTNCKRNVKITEQLSIQQM